MNPTPHIYGSRGQAQANHDYIRTGWFMMIVSQD